MLIYGTIQGLFSTGLSNEANSEYLMYTLANPIFRIYMYWKEVLSQCLWIENCKKMNKRRRNLHDPTRKNAQNYSCLAIYMK